MRLLASDRSAADVEGRSSALMGALARSVPLAYEDVDAVVETCARASLVYGPSAS